MGQLSHYADPRAERIEAYILSMIQAALVDVVTPLCATIHVVVVRIAACEFVHGATEEVDTFRCCVEEWDGSTEIYKHVHNFLDFEIQDVLEMPSATTGDENKIDDVVDPEAKAEIEEDAWGWQGEFWLCIEVSKVLLPQFSENLLGSLHQIPHDQGKLSTLTTIDICWT